MYRCSKRKDHPDHPSIMWDHRSFLPIPDEVLASRTNSDRTVHSRIDRALSEARAQVVVPTASISPDFTFVPKGFELETLTECSQGLHVSLRAMAASFLARQGLQ